MTSAELNEKMGAEQIGGGSRFDHFFERSIQSHGVSVRIKFLSGFDKAFVLVRISVLGLLGRFLGWQEDSYTSTPL